MVKKSIVSFLFICVVVTGSVRAKTEPPNPVIAKWFGNSDAAISLTYDDGAPNSQLNKIMNKFVLENGLSIDYEIVTHDYIVDKGLNDYLKKEMIPSGLGYYGHGHKHVNHDKLTYEAALISFQRCYEAMKTLGLKPVAYSYPNGAGNRPDTKKALAESGFLSGRLHYSAKMTNPYIVPDTQTEPEDWFGLPTLVMQDYTFTQCKKCVNNNDRLIPYLDETIRQKAWIILTYHAIGDEKGYGFFKYDEFQKNIYSIKDRNFWNASMNAVTLYTRERLHAAATIEPVTRRGKTDRMRITVSDKLPNDIYDQPLTILFTIPGEWVNKPIDLVEKEKTVQTVVFNSTNAMISIKPDEMERYLIPSTKNR